MPCFFRPIAFLCGAICLFISTSTHAPAKPAPLSTASALMPEVRLRKIHIVRPDLIPYPIAYEIDC